MLEPEAWRVAGPSALQRAASALLEAAIAVTGMSPEEVWLEYFALGGNRGLCSLTAMIAGRAPFDAHDHDRVVVAVNERFVDMGLPPIVPSWDGSR